MRRPRFMAIAILTMVFAAAIALPSSFTRNGARAATGPPGATQVLNTPAGAQLAWVLTTVNEGGGALTEADLATHFTPELSAFMPPEQLTGSFQQLATLGPLELRGFTRPPTSTQAIALLAGAGGEPLVLAIAVEATAPHRITGLTLSPVPAPGGVELHPFAIAGGSGEMARRFDIGGRHLYLSCRGTGGPTVVLESGLGDSAAPWFAVESAVAGFTRVCTYDRANTVAGASDPAPMPRTGQDASDDLHALLRAAGVPGPYVLAGHSIGGHVARLYAAEHPEEVAGLVLIDASHEEQGVAFQAALGPAPEHVEPAPEPDESNPEGMDRDATIAQVRAARTNRPLPAMPLVVVTAGRLFEPEQLPPGVSADALAQIWRKLHADLAGLVPGGRQVVAERSGHYIHQSEPELVINAIRDVVEAVRQHGTAKSN